jgi:hypothetical protein
MQLLERQFSLAICSWVLAQANWEAKGKLQLFVLTLFSAIFKGNVKRKATKETTTSLTQGYLALSPSQ